MATITYRTSRRCDYGDREVTQSVQDFVNNRHVDIGKLTELLVDQGVLSLDAVFSALKTHGEDYHLLTSKKEEW